MRALNTTALFIFAGCGGQTPEDKGTPAAEQPPGQVQVTPNAIDFGALELHETARSDLVVTNTGKGPLQVYDVQIDDDNQRVHWSLEGGLSGQIDPERSVVITVIARPMDLVDPSMHLHVLSDDPEDPLVDISVLASVFGVPSIRLDPPSSLSVDSVTVGETVTAMVHVGNDGTDDLTITGVELLDEDSAWSVSVDPTGSLVRPNSEDGLVVLTFAPAAVQAYSNTLVISSNDRDQPAVSIMVSGAGAAPQEP